MNSQSIMLLVLLVIIAGVVAVGPVLRDRINTAIVGDDTSSVITRNATDTNTGSTKIEETAPGPKVEIYDGISVPVNTTSLDLSGRGLTGSLKAEVGQLTNLERLDLSGNAFTGLPAEVGHLSKLTTIHLENNQFTGLPHELGSLSHLEYLNVSGNNISQPDLDFIRAALPKNTVIITNNDT